MSTKSAFNETLIVSDVHLGLPASRPQDLLKLIKHRSYDRLILLGDMFHELHFRHLCRDAWVLLDTLKDLAEEKKCELVWIKGNHDRGLEHAVQTLLGITGHEQYSWTSGGRKFLAVHGDCFDHVSVNYPNIDQFFTKLNAWLQRTAGVDQTWIDKFDAIHARISGFGMKMIMQAAKMAHSHACEAIICGHTHKAISTKVDLIGNQIDYVNAGAWLGHRGNFVTVDNGVAKLNSHL